MFGLCLVFDAVLGPQVLPFTPSAGTFASDCSVFDISVRDGVKLILWRKSEGPLIIEEEEVDGSFLSSRFRNFPFLFLGVGVVVCGCCCCCTIMMFSSRGSSVSSRSASSASRCF